MGISEKIGIYLLVVLIAFALSVRKKAVYERGDVFLSLLLISTVVSEAFAIYMGIKYGNNMIVYHYFNPIQLFLIAAYYNYIIPRFRKYDLGIVIGIIGLVIGIINTAFIQSVRTLNSYYLLFEGFVVIALTLELFLAIIRTDDSTVFRSKHLWIAIIFLFYWSITYGYWALFSAFNEKAYEVIPALGDILWLVNIITYGGIALVFYLNKRKVLRNEF